MKTVRNIALVLAAGSALALGAAAYAQETKKPETQPEAREHQHRGQHGMPHGQHGMQKMGGGCHQQS